MLIGFATLVEHGDANDANVTVEEISPLWFTG